MSRKSSWIELGLLILIFVIGVLLRTYRLPELMAFTYDQGRDMFELAKIANGDITLIGPTTGIEGIFLGPFYFYALMPGFLLSSGSPIGVALWVAVVVAFTVPLAYALLKTQVSSKWAMLGALVLTILPGAVNDSRVIWNPSITPPVLAASWLCLFSSLKRPWLLAPALFIYGLALQTEFAYVVFLTPVYGWWILLHSPLRPYLSTFLQRVRTLLRLSKQSPSHAPKPLYSWPVVAASVAIAATTLLPQVIFELKHQFLMTNALQRELATPGRVIPYSVLWDERPQFLSTTFNERMFSDSSLISMIGFIAILLLALRASFAPSSNSTRFLLLCAVMPMLGLLVFRGNDGQIFNYYLHPQYLPWVLAIVLIIAQYRSRVMQGVSAVVLVLMTVLAFIKTASVIYNPDILQYTFGRQVQAYQFARSQTTSSPPTIAVFVPNLRPVQYQYLNEWYSKAHNVVPAQLNDNQTNDPILVLLYEPAFAGGSLLEFDKWFARSTDNASCTPTETFGIINVATCYRLNM